MRPAIQVVEVAGRRDRERFLALPGRLHARDPAYVEPLRLQMRDLLTPGRNPALAHMELALFLALSGGRPVGRISAQLDHLAVEAHGPVGHFGLLAAETAEAAAALLAAAEAWLKGRGMLSVRGPFNLSINQEAGLLVQGFDTPPMLLTPHDQPHLGPAVEAAGYVKARDLLAYRVSATTPSPALPGGLRAAAGKVRIRPLERARLDDELARALAIFNDAWAGNWGFVPFTPAEMSHMAEELRPLLVPDLALFAELGGEPVAMLIALPDLNEAVRGLGGRLLPLGWARLLWRLKVRGPKATRVPLMGVKRRLHGTPLGAALPFLLAEALRPALAERGFRTLEMSWVLEDNRPMRRFAEAQGGVVAKTWRIYEKELA